MMVRVPCSMARLARLLEMEGESTLEALLRTACKMLSWRDCQLRQSDGSVLSRLGRRHPGIRFPLPAEGKRGGGGGGSAATEGGEASWQRAFVAVQVCLGREENFKLSYAARRELVRIHERVKGPVMALVELMEARQKDDPIGLRNAIELAGAVLGGSWHEGSAPLQQVAGIGGAYARLLYQAGIVRVTDLQHAEPHRLEMILGRATPFGLTLLAAARKLPDPSLEVTSTVTDAGLSISLRASCSADQLQKGGQLYVLTVLRRRGQCQLLLFHNLRSSSSNERVAGEGLLERSLTVKGWSPGDEVTVSLMSAEHGKCD